MQIILSVLSIALILILFFWGVIWLGSRAEKKLIFVCKNLTAEQAIDKIETWGKAGIIISIAYGSSKRGDFYTVVLLPPIATLYNYNFKAKSFIEAIETADQYIKKENWLHIISNSTIYNFPLKHHHN